MHSETFPCSNLIRFSEQLDEAAGQELLFPFEK